MEDGMSNLRKRRYHWHQSEKAGIVYLDSSYELKAAMLLDNEPNVATYKVHQIFITPDGKKRFTDFIVTYIDGTICLIEIKPARRLPQFVQQIEDNKNYAASQGWDFKIWTESDLQFLNESDATAWADSYLSKIDGIDYTKIRKIRGRQRVEKHYHEKIKNNKTEYYCKHCNENHIVLKLIYERDIKNNEEYICIRENGRRIGSRPKDHLKKINPHAHENKQECINCKEVLDYSCFSVKNKLTGKLMNVCKRCRSEAAAAKYHAKKK